MEDFKKKYKIYTKPTLDEARRSFNIALGLYKKGEVDAVELGNVATTVSSATYNDGTLYEAILAAIELDYYDDIAKDKETTDKFKKTLDDYWNQIKQDEH